MAAYPELQGKTVLVTGGANGIGKATVRAFHDQGALVHFCDIDAAGGRKLVKTLGNARFERVDLTSVAQIKRWVAKIRRQEKAIHVLVNNAAADPRIPFAKTEAKTWDALFARNLRAYFLMAREAASGMGAGASIINLASITFHLAPANMCAYVATKGGVMGFTRALARDLGPQRIRVNTVSPGWIMTERQLKQFVTASVKRLIRKSQCVPDLLQPVDIAEVILFLASDASRAITGQEILADRGWMHS